ncbi:MAG: hypothetical protein A2Z68_00745, partial [Candidatus Nealsonbacteria bacterium RBG_13_38_11]
VSSLNFALKSDDEQKAIIYQFQNFLNSLDFSIEIVLQSRILNITGYIDKLKEIERIQDNELMKIQTAEYRKFITELIGGRQILSKTFFLTVPFTLVEMPKFAGKKEIDFNDSHFQRAKSQLWQRMEFVAVGLRRCGLQCSPLNTLELIELFWSLHHPEESEVGYYPDIPPEIIK